MSPRPQLLAALARVQSPLPSTRNLSCLKGLRLPIEHSPGAAPNVLYCHGLGGAYNLPLPVKTQEYVAQHKKHGFTRFQYRNVQDVSRVWHVNDWLEDIVDLLDRMYPEVGAQMIMASSAGAHAALRATIARPEKVHSLFLLAPGVGLDLSYMDRLVPGSVRLLKQGKRVLHPAVKGGYNACVDLQCLTDYVNTCLSNALSTIPIKCPVRVLHGMKDPIVPYQNSVNFVKKLESSDVKLQLLEDQGHNMQLIPEVISMLDDLLAKTPAGHYENEQNKPLPDIELQYQVRHSKL